MKRIEWLNEFKASDLTESAREAIALPSHAQTDLDCQSIVNYEPLINALADIVLPAHVMGIGVEQVSLRLYLAEMCHRYGAQLTLIDEDIGHEVLENISHQVDRRAVSVQQGRSTDVLETAPLGDFIVMDKNRNYESVLQELSLIDRRLSITSRVMLLIHHVGWPCGRRNMFARPEESQDTDALTGAPISPFVPGTTEDGLEFNSAKAPSEGGPGNGVRTAIEDFLKDSEREWRSITTPLFYGMMVLWDEGAFSTEENTRLNLIAEAVKLLTPLFGTAELNRLMLLIRLHHGRKVWAIQRSRISDLEKRLYEPRKIETVGQSKEVNRSGPLAKFNPRADTINYLINFSTKFRYVYVETPKVACSTIKRTLQALELGVHDKAIPKNVHDKQASPLLSPNDNIAEFATALTSDRYFRFCFVRNPFGRILSCFLDKFVINQWERNLRLPKLGFERNANVSFLDFLAEIRKQEFVDMDIHWMPQSFILSRGAIDYTVLGRFESFEADFMRILAVLRGDSPTMIGNQTIHATQATTKVAEYVGSKEKKIILELYEQDFNEFGYSRDERYV